MHTRIGYVEFVGYLHIKYLRRLYMKKERESNFELLKDNLHDNDRDITYIRTWWSN